MNSGYYPFIIVAMYVIVHVISAIAKESSQRKERARLREAAERRQSNPMSAQSTDTAEVLAPTSVSAPPVPATRPVNGGKSLDSLAAMRKQQLEQLRARQRGRQATSKPQVRVGTPTTQTTQAAPNKTIRMPGVQPQDPFATRQERQIRERELAKARMQKEAQLARQRAMMEKARRESEQAAGTLREVEDKTAAEPFAARSADIQPASRTRTNSMRQAISNRLENREQLRELFILREVLDPPIAMREA